MLTWGVEVFAFQRWFGCWLFREMFYFTSQTLEAQLINAQNEERGIPLFIVRALHNKILALGWGLPQTLLQYWDIRFLEEFVGIVGAVGVGLGLWYLLTKDRKNYVMWIIVGLGIILPLIEMFFMPHVVFSWVLYACGFIFQALSLYGIWKFLSEKKYILWRYMCILFLIVVSFLMILLFHNNFLTLCLKI